MKKVWRSPTLFSWLASIIRLAAMLLIIPLVLRSYQAEEAALWLLCQSLFTLASLSDWGFQHSFTRLFSYIRGGIGLADLGRTDQRPKAGDSVNTDDLAAVSGTAKAVLVRLILGAGMLLGLVALLSSEQLISAMDKPAQGWVAVLILVAGMLLQLGSFLYTCFLLGMSHILSLRRWECLAAAGQSISLCAGVLAHFPIWGLMLIAHCWTAIILLRNRTLCRADPNAAAFFKAPARINPLVKAAALPAMVRTGLGVLSTQGVLQLSGIILAQIGTPAEVARYLFHLRLAVAVRQFALPPFFNRLPTLSQLFAQGDLNAVAQQARLGMALSYWTLTVGLIGTAITAPLLLMPLLPADVAFDPSLWRAFCLAFLIERVAHSYGHFSAITNDVIWHRLAMRGGLFSIAATFALFPVLSTLAFPLAYAAGLALLFLPQAALACYRRFALPMPEYEVRTSLGPAAIVLLWAGLAILV